MQTFQTRQILATIKLNVPARMLFLTSRCKNKPDPQFAVFFFGFCFFVVVVVVVVVVVFFCFYEEQTAS